MAGPSLQTEAFVLHRRPPAESFQSFTVFSAEHGTLQTLQRIGGKNAAPLDLFDAVALVLESSNQGRTWFIRESRLIARHTGIGRNYEGLRLASELASLVTRNAVPEESRRAVADLLRGAFGAFETGVRPDIVFFKSLYRFARDEGYPLKQHWFPSLPAEDRQDVAALLNLPLAEQSAPAPSVLRLQRRLEDYLRGHTEILLD
ncbi:MAG: hypothetical protein B9S34_02710 [Opitutia bacterium Tous-C1TDCM]|nr:MAG: hypothetical protein B9S34_02710 [Opitutae bacterium Tous-C1TDCM]